MKKFKFSKFLSMLLAVLVIFFTTGLDVRAATTIKTTISSAETDTTGSIVALTFNKTMQDPTGKQALFKVSINGAVQTPAKLSLDSTKYKINLTLNTPVKNGNTVTVTYTPNSRTMIKSTDNVALSSFSNFAVINKVPAPTPVVTETINYVSLGDSIATGTTGTTSTTSFPYMFRNYLQNTYYPAVNAGQNKVTNVQLFQDAVNGLTTPELIDLLTPSTSTYNSAVVEHIKAANIITVSTGGNDLMQWAEIPGFATVDWVNAEKSANDFVSTNWINLISIIKSLNSNAKVIVLTGYNPYNSQAVSGYASDVATTLDGGYSFSSMTEELVAKMHNTVTGNAVIKGYLVADVYSDFHTNFGTTKMGQITKFYPYLFGIAAPTLRDPHPNQTGQNRIASLINAFYPLP